MDLEVHVFGADQGESILIKFPSGKWGVVDCYASSNDASSNEPLKFLLDRKVEELYFVCMTHPHHDHYSGLTHIIDRIPTRQFWFPGVMTVDYLRSIAKLEAQAHKATSNSKYDGRLIQLWEKVSDLQSQSKISFRRLSLGTDLGTKGDLGVEIVSLAPSGDESHHFDQSLKSCFRDGKLLEKKRQAEINRCSIALSLMFSEQRVVLGGDVESKGWIDLLEQQASLASSACVVKVAHHGSLTGRCDKLWQAYAGNARKRVAVLTPYWKHRLPSQNVIAEILSSGYELYSTSKIARPKPPDTPKQALANLLTGSLISTDRKGCISISIAANGSIAMSPSGQARKLSTINNK